MFFSKMTVASRLYASFGLVIALLVAVTVVAVIKVERIDKALKANSEVYSQVQRHAINFRGSAHDRSIAVRDLFFGSTPEDRARTLSEIDALAQFYAQSTTAIEALLKLPSVSPEVPSYYADIQKAEQHALTITRTLISQIQNGDVAASETLWTQAKPAYEAWLASINRLIDLKEKHIQATNQRAMDEASGFLSVMFIALASALVLSLIVAWAVARSIVRQLGAEPSALARIAQQVAQGDLKPLQQRRSVHPSSVLASLQSMQMSLADVVRQVRQACDAVTHGANDIASGNADLLTRSYVQTQHLQTASDAMQAMTQTVKQTSETAWQAEQLAGSATEAAHNGGRVVSEVIHTMDEISESSHRIATITSVIDGIAFQTNILALNAAVEAARAGKEGRGFAVVADEVRALAKRSADAARQIKDLIEASVTKVQQGSQLVGDAGNAMTNIVNQAQQVATLMTAMTRASTEQTQGIGQVEHAVEQLEAATQQNTAMVEQSGVAANALKQQATQLAAAVRIFRLDGTEQTHAEAFSSSAAHAS